jgi:ribonuclease BN (tRNA processing enzyme)
MFTDEEYNRNPHWGHSAASHAVDVCKAAGARHLVIFHHAPERSDDQMDRMMEDIVAHHGGQNLTISPAIEGRVIELG